MKKPRVAPDPDLLFKAVLNENRLSVSSHRFFLDSLTKLLPPPRGTRYRYGTLAGVRVKWVGGFSEGSQRLIFYLHGGGYIMGSARTHRFLAAHLCRAVGAKALLVDYRLAPEHPFPAALDDALAVYRFLLSHGVNPRNIIVAGDSAGGGLSLALMHALKQTGEPLPAAAYLMSPWVDLTPSRRPFFGYKNSRFVVDWSADMLAALYCAGNDPEHPFLSPLFGDFSGFPPMVVTAGRFEPLRRDGALLAQKARDQGVEVLFQHYRSPIHVVQGLAPLSPGVRRMIRRHAEFLQQNCPGTDGRGKAR
ncbi:MAG: alpha/beta hydrolase [Thermodesulfobacteriota bacterium]